MKFIVALDWPTFESDGVAEERTAVAGAAVTVVVTPEKDPT